MKTRALCLLCLSLALMAGALGSAHATKAQLQPAPTPPALDPDLARALAQAHPDDVLRVIVVLREQAVPEQAALSATGRTEARAQVVAALQATAARTQAPLRAYLAQAQTTGQVQSYTPFWIVNAVAVRARPSVIHTLASRTDVAALRLDHYRRWIQDSENGRWKVEGGKWILEAPFSILHPPFSALHPPFSILRSPSSILQSPEWNISHIRAPEVWVSLNISGTGAVVAGMDTGVDWQHPALQANYRGYNPHGPANHTFSWYDATDGGALYPVDGHGHGTHTLGTAVGQDGIGVAPGAQWVAVRVFNNQGTAYDSWIHAGFQWLLAPGGDPARAPDVVNCSWGNDNGWLTVFQPDLQALRAAGIFAVFSNGNNGPDPSTVSSPASLPEAFAVGAIDPYDQPAYFSSRGPSPWGEVRPHVAAPGVNVRSSLPGGAYGSWQGTSMAAPHVTGIALLLRSVSPTLSIAQTAFVITSTAVPLTTTIPNNDTGWGRVDAFAAVAALAQPGFIGGTVVRAGDGVPIAGATVAATPREGGGGGIAVTGGDGAYLLALTPATYDVAVSAFGYEPTTAAPVAVTNGTTTVRDFSLTALPAGILRGQVTDAVTGEPVTATISVLDTPLATTASAYEFALPAGHYTVRARSLGHRVVTATLSITAGQVSTADFALPPAPTILLVDSGPWTYSSEIGYFRQALDDLAYAYDEWAVRRLPDDVPTASDLTCYDIVVWSAPQDAPGFIGAEKAVVGYLSAGGRLFLSGQDIGFLDGGGLLWSYAAYYWDYLKAQMVQDNAGQWTLEGTPGDIFAGQTITIAGPGGADNQNSPDGIAVADPDAAAPVFAYQSEGCGDALSRRAEPVEALPKGGLRVGTCLNYRAVYLSFGFEAINDRTARREVMDRALAWLVADPPAIGLELTPLTQTHIGSPGAAVTHTLRLRHVGQSGTTDTISLALEGATLRAEPQGEAWAAQVSSPSLALGPCVSATVVVTVTVPPTAAWNVRDVVTLTARSSLSPTLVLTAVLTTKTPAPILLVDDDRWYDQEAQYEAALASDGFVYDYWSTGGDLLQGSPPLDVLQRYPLVVWFTGYDWFAPVTADEETALAAYLDGGGRLFLSSQDFLYYHYGEPFSLDYLGVLTYTEETTPTLALGVPEDAIGDHLGPYPLTYPFTNWSDAMQPTPGTAVSFRDQARRGIALARRPEVGARSPRPATVFFSFPFETLMETARSDVMERVVGWLSWLGGSTFATSPPSISSEDGTLTYTLVLRNDGPTAVTAWLSNTLPLSLTLVPGSLTGPSTALGTGPASYDDATRRVTWEGTLGSGAAVTVTYRATLEAGVTAGAAIANTARLGLPEHFIQFDRTAPVRVGTPDLSESSLGCAPNLARPGAVVTCTLALVNTGSADALAATAAISLPTEAAFLPGSLAWEGGGAAEALSGAVRWAGPLNAGGQMTLTVQLALPTDPVHVTLYSVAFLDDGFGGAWERPAWVILDPWRTYMPVVYQGFRWEPWRLYFPAVFAE